MFPSTAPRRRGELYQGQFYNASQSSIQISRSRSFDRTAGSNTSNIFPSIGVVFKFAEFVLALGEASSENRIFVNLINRVRQDLGEAFRLRNSRPVTDNLSALPIRRSWIDGIIFDIQQSLNKIGIYVENTKIDAEETDNFRLKHRFEWVLRHHQKLVSRELALNTCHQSLMGAIQIMQAVELGSGVDISEKAGPTPPAHNIPARSWLSEEDDEILRPPHSRKRGRNGSTRSHSVPGVILCEYADEILPEAVVVMPAELPGSTPSQKDLHQSLSLRGTSGYFPSLPVIPRQDPRFYELAGPMSFSRSTMSLPLSSSQSTAPSSIPMSRSTTILPSSVSQSTAALATQKAYRPLPYITRKALTKHSSLPVPLPCLPRQPSLESELSEYLLPHAEADHEEDDMRSPMSDHIASSSEAGGFSPTSEAATVATTATSFSTDTSPVVRPASIEPLHEVQRQPLTTQEKRRRAHTRRLEAAFGGD